MKKLRHAEVKQTAQSHADDKAAELGSDPGQPGLRGHLSAMVATMALRFSPKSCTVLMLVILFSQGLVSNTF